MRAAAPCPQARTRRSGPAPGRPSSRLSRPVPHGAPGHPHSAQRTRRPDRGQHCRGEGQSESPPSRGPTSPCQRYTSRAGMQHPSAQHNAPGPTALVLSWAAGRARPAMAQPPGAALGFERRLRKAGPAKVTTPRWATRQQRARNIGGARTVARSPPNITCPHVTGVVEGVIARRCRRAGKTQRAAVRRRPHMGSAPPRQAVPSRAAGG